MLVGKIFRAIEPVRPLVYFALLSFRFLTVGSICNSPCELPRSEAHPYPITNAIGIVKTISRAS